MWVLALIIDTPGTYIGKSGNMLVIKIPDKGKKEISIRKVTCVIINSRAQVTYDALLLLMRYGVPVVYVKQNQPVAVCHPFSYHGTVLTRRQQILAYLDNRGVRLAKAFITGSIENKARLLLRFAKARAATQPDLAEVLREQAQEIRANLTPLAALEGNMDDLRWQIMGYEGDAAKRYFGMLAKILPKDLQFEGRVRRPPRDPVNTCLSFAYTILGNQILVAIAVAGLEPFAGFLHSDRSGKPSLALDLMEEFRQPVVDRIVVRLFTKRELTKEDFTEQGGRLLFAESGKKKFLEEIFSAISAGVTVDGKVVPFTQLMVNQARNLVRFLLKHNAEYTPFLLPW